MDSLFKASVLTAAINEIKTPVTRIFDRFFRGKLHFSPSSLLQFDIITGSQKILKNLTVYAPAQVRDKTGRKTVTMEAPRLSQKRQIPAADLDSLRKLGTQMFMETLKERLAREQLDMRNEADRTLEFWAANALKGKIYDSDLSTVLVDYGLDASHDITLTGDDLFSSAASDPITRFRTWKRTIEDDSAAAIIGWLMYLGGDVMDALLAHAAVRDLLKVGKGTKLAEDGTIERLAKIDLAEYNGSFLDDDGTRRRFIEADEIVLVGLCDDLVDCPYGPVVDLKAPGGVGNTDGTGAGVQFFSKAWEEEDPSGTWVKAESRTLPVVQRPGAIIRATVL